MNRRRPLTNKDLIQFLIKGSIISNSLDNVQMLSKQRDINVQIFSKCRDSEVMLSRKR